MRKDNDSSFYDGMSSCSSSIDIVIECSYISFYSIKRGNLLLIMFSMSSMYKSTDSVLMTINEALSRNILSMQDSEFMTYMSKSKSIFGSVIISCLSEVETIPNEITYCSNEKLKDLYVQKHVKEFQGALMTSYSPRSHVILLQCTIYINAFVNSAIYKNTIQIDDAYICVTEDLKKVNYFIDDFI